VFIKGIGLEFSFIVVSLSDFGISGKLSHRMSLVAFLSFFHGLV
jgi:hypothetical protein